MSNPDSSITSALLERIIAVERSLVMLRCDDDEDLLVQLQQHALRTGQAIYLWREAAGLHSLREGELPVPGCLRVGDALRYVAQSAHFGIYFFVDPGDLLDPVLAMQLSQVARMGGERIRRVVLLGSGITLPSGVEACELDWHSSERVRPRLRDGRWVR